jgi:cysteine desulfurase/selenocysteine lyase
MDIEKIRSDFPLLQKEIGNKKIVYFDNACTSLKPKQVIQAISDYYTDYGACVGRSVHKLSAKTTERFDEARDKVAKFINARKSSEIIWTKNTTEAMNLVAHGFVFKKKGNVVTTNLEHTSGLLPWQGLAASGAINLDFVLCDKDGVFDINKFSEKINKNTDIVSVLATSNVTGTSLPIKEIAKIAHDNGALLVVDGAQSVPHSITNVRDSGIDFLAFSGHKMLGPTGIGCLYGREELLGRLRPLTIGGGSITNANLNSYVPNKLPDMLEGGIQDYSGAFGFGAAIDYLNNIGMRNIIAHEKELSKRLITGMLSIEGPSIIGPRDWKVRETPLVSFTIEGMEAHDIAYALDSYNIAIRSGTHCTYPFHRYISKEKGSARASLYFYNTFEEVDFFINKLNDTIKTLV